MEFVIEFGGKKLVAKIHTRTICRFWSDFPICETDLGVNAFISYGLFLMVACSIAVDINSGTGSSRSPVKVGHLGYLQGHDRFL